MILKDTVYFIDTVSLVSTINHYNIA